LNGTRKIIALVAALIALLCCSLAAADTVTLPAGLKVVSEEMFAGDQSLDRVVVPDGVTRIESRAFADSSLAVITIYGSVNYIAPDAFANCDVIACVTSGSYAESYCKLNNIPTRPASLEDTFRMCECEVSDWFEDDIDLIFFRRNRYTGSSCSATVYDVETGKSFRVRRVGGDNHADVEPLTPQDTAMICNILLVNEPSEINSREHYQRRPVLVAVDSTYGTRLYAASMYMVLHDGGRPESEVLLDNGLEEYGMGGYIMCMHFLNSRTSGSGVLDASHQRAIQTAYAWWQENYGK